MKNFTKFFTFLTALLLSSSMVNAQCLDFADGPWADLGSAQCAAECADGPIEAGYQAWTNEAYVINEAQPGAEYVFSICDGHDSSVWAAELTAAEYDGEVAVPTAVFATVQDCEITFTVPADYDAPITVIIVVADLNDCGGASQQTDNGFVTFGCGAAGGQQACGDPISCADAVAGTISGTTDFCFDEVTDFALEGAVIPNEGEAFGHFWIITTEDISGSTDPFNEASSIGNFAVGETPISPIGTANDGGPNSIPTGTFYITSVVFGNGTAVAGANPILDPNCTFSSESFMFNFIAEGECGGCPTISFATTACVDGEFFVEANVTALGDFGLLDLTDGTNTTSTTETGVIQFGPYAAGTEVIISSATGDVECDVVSGVLTNNCESVEGCLLFNTGPFTDINTATPSPLDCANGIVELGFQAWTNEAYIIQTLDPANTYTFSICNGYDEGNWSAILSVVDAVDPTIVIAQNDATGCEITFNVEAAGDVIVIVADANNCGGDTEQIDNGFVAFGCEGEVNPCPSISFDTTPCVGDEFSVEAVVSSLGDFGLVDLTDGITTQSVTAAGSVQFGPYAAGTEITISASTGDANCDVTSAVLTDDCAGDPCTLYNTGPYTDINTATPSPLDCANGIVELGFQAWTNEAYIVQALPAGQPFVFSICNGYDANVWPAVLSVVDALDPTIVIAQAQDCQVSFTLDTPGDVFIVVANGNDCGGDTQEIDNGIVGFGCDATACAANAGELVPPLSTVFAEGEMLVVDATNYQENPEYGYAYVMTDGAPDYNIIALSYEGEFELTAGGEFTIHGLSIAVDDLPAIQVEGITGNDIVDLISVGLCADLLVADDETFTISVIVGIEDNNNNAFLNINEIAPVPANNAVTVNFTSKYQSVTAQVTDLTGRIIDTYEVNTAIGNNTLSLDINNYAAGVYMLNLRSAEATVNAKFIKQ